MNHILAKQDLKLSPVDNAFIVTGTMDDIPILLDKYCFKVNNQGLYAMKGHSVFVDRYLPDVVYDSKYKTLSCVQGDVGSIVNMIVNHNRFTEDDTYLDMKIEMDWEHNNTSVVLRVVKSPLNPFAFEEGNFKCVKSVRTSAKDLGTALLMAILAIS